MPRVLQLSVHIQYSTVYAHSSRVLLGSPRGPSEPDVQTRCVLWQLSPILEGRRSLMFYAHTPELLLLRAAAPPAVRLVRRAARLRAPA